MRELTKDYDLGNIQDRNLSNEHIVKKNDGTHVVRERWSSTLSNNEVKRCRRWFKLRSLKPGKRSCLKCDRQFDSPDISSIKMCDSCKYLVRSMT